MKQPPPILRLRLSLAAAALALCAACAGGAPRGPMSAGQRLYMAKCTSCHSAYEPSAYPPKKWRENVAEMEDANKVHLTPEERAEILSYLTGDAQGRDVAHR